MPPRILIVEDNPSARAGLEELLREAGYDARTASTFREGRQALEHDAPDLLITDIRLDGFNGLQLVHVNPRPIPAIIITGYPDDVLRNDARRLGAEYVLKPFAPATLLETIDRLLKSSVRAEERRRAPRKRVTTDLPVEADTLPARVLDLSERGVRVEVMQPHPKGTPQTLQLLFPTTDVAVDVDVVWSLADEAGRWQFGGSVSAAEAPIWAQLLAATA